MPQHDSLSTNQETSLRAKQIKSIIRKLKRKIQKISSEGEVAPPHCHVIRYQTKQNQKIYWYYKLQAAEPIFPTATDKNKKSKYLYLGKAGSEAHLDAVEKGVQSKVVADRENRAAKLSN